MNRTLKESSAWVTCYHQNYMQNHSIDLYNNQLPNIPLKIKTPQSVYK